MALSDHPEPHSLEAEEAVLGASMLYADALEQALEVVTASDFYRHENGQIFGVMQAIAQRRETVDAVTVKNALRAAGILDACGGPVYVAKLLDGVPRASNVASYARIVREKATLRELMRASRRILADAQEAEEGAAKVLDTAQQALYEIAVDRSAGGFLSIRDVISDEVMPLVDLLVERKQAVSGVPTGLFVLDGLTRGFQTSDLVLLAARPSMGKTALAMSAAVHAATVADLHVGVFSLEMSRRDLGLRAVIAEAGIDGSRVRAGRIFDNEWEAWSRAVGTIAESKLHIDDSSMVTINDIRARARRLKAQVGLDLIVVDYLQLVTPSKKHESVNHAMAEISKGLKGIAKDLSVPVLALSQLSRSCESRADKRPLLSDLRDSGALEQDADLVLSIYRDEVYNEHTTDAGCAEIAILKHRNGPTGTVTVGFDKHQTRFYNRRDDRAGAVA